MLTIILFVLYLYKSLGHSTNDEHKKLLKKVLKSAWRNELNLIE